MRKTPLDDFEVDPGGRAMYLAHEIVQHFKPGKRCIALGKADPEFVWLVQKLRELIRQAKEK